MATGRQIMSQMLHFANTNVITLIPLTHLILLHFARCTSLKEIFGQVIKIQKVEKLTEK